MSNDYTPTEMNEELDGRYLLFYIADTLYGVPLSLVLEIMNIQHITKIPNTANYVKGVINLRGKIIPVLDMRLKLKMEERPYDDKTSIIISDINDIRIGIIVDGVSEVVTVDPEHITAPPTTGDKDTLFLDSITDFGDHVALNLSLEKFLADDIL